MQDALKPVPGVQNVDTNVDKRQATITIKKGEVKASKLIEVLKEKTGYDSTVVSK